MKRHLSGWAVGAVALALISVGAARGADLGYTFKSYAVLDSMVGTEQIHGDFEYGSVNADGTVGFVTELDNGEGAFTLTADGKATLLYKGDNDAPTGGKFGGYISNKVDVNDAGNDLIAAGVDIGNGNNQEILFFDKTANKWTVICKEGMPAPDGGTFQASNSFGGLNNSGDIVFSGVVDDSSAGPAGNGIFLWSKGKVTNISRPGTKADRGALVDSWRPEISNSGIITFEGKIGDDDNYGAFMVDPKVGKIVELASVKTKAPDASGKPTADNFEYLKGVQANSNGDVSMIGSVNGGKGVYLYSAKDKTLRKIAGPGDPMPGGGTLDNVSDSYRNSVRIGEDGAVYFEATLDAGVGVYRWNPTDGSIGVIVRTGQTMQGLNKKAADTGTGNGLAVSTKGHVGLTIQTDDGVEHLIVATPPAPPAAGP